MSEILICESNILENSYKYFLVEKVCDIESIGKSIRYGIKVNSYNKNGRITDTKTIYDVFGNKRKMIKAIDILMKLKVTPITLEDVVIDNIY